MLQASLMYWNVSFIIHRFNWNLVSAFWYLYAMNNRFQLSLHPQMSSEMIPPYLCIHYIFSYVSRAFNIFKFKTTSCHCITAFYHFHPKICGSSQYKENKGRLSVSPSAEATCQALGPEWLLSI